MRVRVAAPRDAAPLTPIYRASYTVLLAPAYPAEVLAAALPAMTDAQPDLLASGTYFVAEDGGRVLGGGGWTKGAPGSGDREEGVGHIRHFAVRPDCAGQGVGRALFEACRTSALAAGVRRFRCFSSLNGAAFYRAMGFQDIARRDVPIGGAAFAVMEMSRALA